MRPRGIVRAARIFRRVDPILPEKVKEIIAKKKIMPPLTIKDILPAKPPYPPLPVIVLKSMGIIK